MQTGQQPAIVIIGAGIMSATLAILLKELEPGIRIDIFERLPEVAEESTDGWNNAGTGHSAFCELNYTPQLPDGSIDISKATSIASSFEISRQFWASLVLKKYISCPASFINTVPHISFVWGKENVEFLRKRFDALKNQPLFTGMDYSEDRKLLTSWMPLVMNGRTGDDPVAATRMDIGTDVNFGALTRAIMNYLQQLDGVNLYCSHEVRDLDRHEDGGWEITVKDLLKNKKRDVYATFVFVGAGGGTLPLLDKSGIPEAKGYGGFPISGQWLKCTNPQLVAQHHAKVYGKAPVGAPPMSVPHLDSRIMNEKKELLFGPYAGFSTKFLKHGSLMDLPRSIEWENIFPMLSAGWHNLDLTRYLIKQVSQSMEDRIQSLKEYFPAADQADWELELAGQRVQVIKKDEEEGGVLEFGTELVTAADGSLAGLLGASPGASTAMSIMLEVLLRCFPQNMRSVEWQFHLKDLLPSYGRSLADDPALLKETRLWSARLLELHN